MIGVCGNINVSFINENIYTAFPQTAEYKAYTTKLEAAVSLSKTTPAARHDQLMRFKTNRDRDWEKVAKLLRKIYLASQRIPQLEAQVKRDRAAALLEAEQEDEDNRVAELEQKLGALRQQKRKRQANVRKERNGDSVGDNDAQMGVPQRQPPSQLMQQLIHLEGQPDGLNRALDLLQAERQRRQSQQQPLLQPQQQQPLLQPPPPPTQRVQPPPELQQWQPLPPSPATTSRPSSPAISRPTSPPRSRPSSPQLHRADERAALLKKQRRQSDASAPPFVGGVLPVQLVD